MKAILFFLILAATFGFWRITAQRDKKAVKKAVRPFVVPTLLAAAITIALLVFAFTFNGKLI
jgi:hypothetical protein